MRECANFLNILKISLRNSIKKFKIVKTKVDPKTLDIWTQIEQENGIN